MRKRNLNHVILATLVCLGACGGGGGGGIATPIPNPEMQNLFIGKTGPTVQDLSQQVLSNGNYLLRLAQFTTDVVHRFIASGGSRTVTALCAYTGTLTMSFDDTDASQGASAGDRILVTLSNCGVPILARTVTGAIRVDITAGDVSSIQARGQARLTVVDALELKYMQPGNPTLVQPLGTLLGSMAVKWSADTLGDSLQAQSTSEDDLQLTVMQAGSEAVDRMSKIDVSRSTRYDEATVSSALNFLLDLGIRGKVLARTVTPFSSDMNAVPRSGVVEVAIASNQLIRLRPYVTNGTFFDIDVALVPNTLVPPDRLSVPWYYDYGMLMYDIRASSDPTFVGSTFSNVGGGLMFIKPWRGSKAGNNVDMICLQPNSPGIHPYVQADALFQRPVAPEARATSSASTFRLQLGRAIASDSPQLYLRFKDGQWPPRADLPSWSIAATVVRHGAQFEIHPNESLRHARTYYLEASTDGVTWSSEPSSNPASDLVFLDQAGNIVNSSSGLLYLGIIDTDDMLVVDLANTNLTVPSPSQPARLQPIVTTRDGQAISSYHWEQLSGVPIIFSAPDSAVTDVAYATEPRPVAPVTVQLTVTDAQGEVERLRVVLNVGN